ncbi:hypothetical protein SUGI_1042470 [Cryptomeria japonica]|nr:hypothetical protein SUGI_1042470 [Cryptomeria japonica]
MVGGLAQRIDLVQMKKLVHQTWRQRRSTKGWMKDMCIQGLAHIQDRKNRVSSTCWLRSVTEGDGMP